jgi:hypothetical protein
MSKNSCASCKSVNIKKIIKTDNSKIPKWLEKKDYISQFIDSISLKPFKNENSNMKLKINVGSQHKNKYILYWGAESSILSKKSKSILINDAKKAYGISKSKTISNYGVTKVDNEGNVNLFFDCPQPYSTIEKGKKDRETFYRHIHFCFSNKQKSWNSAVYTKIIICELSLKETIRLHKSGFIVLINALPCEYYAKSHIPNSYNLHNKKIKKMSQKKLFEWFSEVVKLNYPKIHKLIQNKKLNIYEIPIVVYCAHKDCNAGYLSAIELLKKGFVNLIDFKGGMKEYLSKNMKGGNSPYPNSLDKHIIHDKWNH